MSDTSLHFKDEGYTSPDFLTNLFKKPLYTPISLSSFQTNSQSCRDLSINTKQNDFPSLGFQKRNSSPLKFKNQTSLSNKYTKSTPIIDEQKISNSKYKIFFKTFMHGTISQEEINQMWAKLQQSLKNPFAFDRFIQDIKTNREKQRQINQLEKRKKDQFIIQQTPVSFKSKTPQKKVNKTFDHEFNTYQKLIFNKKNNLKAIKQQLKKSVFQIKQVLLKGQRIIRKK